MPNLIHDPSLPGGRVRSAVTIAAGTAVTGAVLWLVTAYLGGRREAWDSPLYWTRTYPACVLLSFALGFIAPARPWLWAVTLMFSQAVAMAASTMSFGLLPLGMIAFGVLSVPPTIAAILGAAFRRLFRR